MENLEESLVNLSYEETVEEITIEIRMYLEEDRPSTPMNIYCHDYNKISKAIIESISQTDKKIEFFICQSPITTHRIESILESDGNLETLENDFNEYWSSERSLAKNELDWFLVDNESGEYKEVTASDTKNEHAILFVRDANTLDISFQRDILNDRKLLIIFQSRYDMPFVRKNTDLGITNRMGIYKME